MIYVKVNDTLYPASVGGRMSDKEWDGRESKEITMEADFATVNALFPDGAAWSIVNEDTVPIYDADGNPTGERETVREEYDNSEYSMAGDITDHRDGTVTVVMGKPTELENALAMLLVEGGNGNV